MENDPYAPDKEMDFPTGGKSFGNKPHIKMGYYPGKLLGVKKFTDGDGNPIVGNYGKQLIFSFQVYEKDPETDEPTKPMQIKNSETSELEDVVIPKFVYFEYKDTNKDNSWTNGKFRTAFTPKGMITKVMEALGWTFEKDASVNPTKFIGKWAILNIDDYEHKAKDEVYTASTIKDVKLYKGKVPEEIAKEESKSESKEKPAPEAGSKDSSKEEKTPEPVAKPPVITEDQPKSGTAVPEDVKMLQAKKDELRKMVDDELLTEDGYKQAVEGIDQKIKELGG